MPKFTVFFSDDAGFGIEMFQALDTAHTDDITRALLRRAALPTPVEPRLGAGVAEVLTSLAGMPSC